MAYFNVGGQIRKLEMRDENGVDWSADFIGNTAHGMDYDEDGNFVTDEEEFRWWEDMIEEYQEMEEKVEEYKEKYGREAVEELLENVHAWSMDFADVPSSVKRALEEMDEE